MALGSPISYYQSDVCNLRVTMANANFDYGFEYLGISETLVHTPLTHRAYLTLTQVCSLPSSKCNTFRHSAREWEAALSVLRAPERLRQ